MFKSTPFHIYFITTIEKNKDLISKKANGLRKDEIFMKITKQTKRVVAIVLAAFMILAAFARCATKA